tara:strand:+ start:2526 stop:2897 length:372 start_codon:yes stop_codon:yes gene_type:complete
MPKNKQKTNSDSTISTLSDKKENFLEILELNSGNVSKSCKKANIGRQTYYQWREADQEFADACVDVKEGLLDFAESQLQGLIKENNVIATIFFLKCKGKKRGYTEKQELELVKPISDIEFDEL